ncbi:hypothetical protein KBK19_05985 [Microvirga sp. STR05]|uniref:Lipoprotein with Yx(FWY)xxD motif n=1 Tax=Hymenobacter duratus TaxID=2771356 RepID=A0ABR8JCP9_9BACT|nr:hypothetical protein [Hymenobacter duratus]MBD2714577.1 hypothetical protein [Hymenobacter duratus]MBR7949481.1 hypothetical protein [Microvirga sp. STR05]
MDLTISFRLIRHWRAAHLLAALLLLGSCNNSSDDSSTPAPAPTIKIATSPTLGNYLTDKDNHTLYYFARDVDGGQSQCTGGCATLWPAYYEADIQVGDGMKAADFATSTTAAGQQQTTYKGWPLYYYAPPTNGQNVREQPDQTGGNGISSVWYVASPGYSVLVASKIVLDKASGQSTNQLFLTDGQGRTLYTFRKDAQNPNSLPDNCTGSCETLWPPFYTNGRTFPSVLQASSFSSFSRASTGGSGGYGGGAATSQHLTYKGQPLYYYRADNLTRGRVEGHGLLSEGDTWFVATP